MPRGDASGVIVIPAKATMVGSPTVRLNDPRCRLEAELALQPDQFVLRDWLQSGGRSVEAAGLIGKVVDGRIVVEWKDGLYEKVFGLTNAVSRSQDLDARQVDEVRYSADGSRMLVRLANTGLKEPVWLEVATGGGGHGNGPPRDGMMVGSPDDPDWYSGRLRFDVKNEELAKYRSSTGKGFIRLNLGFEHHFPFFLSRDWFPKRASKEEFEAFHPPVWFLSNGVSEGELKDALLALSVEEARQTRLLLSAMTGKPQDALELAEYIRRAQKDRRLPTDSRDDAFCRLAEVVCQGVVPYEIRVGAGKDSLYVNRQGSIYVVGKSVEAGGVLEPSSPFRYVVARTEADGSRGIRVQDRAIVLPANPKAGDITEARKVVAFLTENSELIPAAGNIADLNERALADLKQKYESLGNGTMLQISGTGGEMAFRIPGRDQEVTAAQLIGWSNKSVELPEGFLEALKKMPVVIDARLLPEKSLNDQRGYQLAAALTKLQAEGVQIIYRLSSGPDAEMPSRLKGLLCWSRLDFEVESAQIDKVTNKWVADFAARWLKEKTFLANEEGADQAVRVIVDHAEKGLTIDELIKRALSKVYENRHVILAVCIDDPKEVADFCKAAYAKGCRSVTIPSGKVNVPTVLLTAETLNRNPAYRGGRIPQEAWVKAEKELLNDLRKVVINSGGDTDKAQELLEDLFPEIDAARMFLDPSKPGNRQKAEETIIKQIEEFIKEAERNTWRQVTIRAPKLSVAGSSLAA